MLRQSLAAAVAQASAQTVTPALHTVPFAEARLPSTRDRFASISRTSRGKS
jgi:hypothetical protein